MLSFIKTALVTIIISFISGVLLDYYRNYAPRILCSMGRNKSIRKNSKKVKVYSLIIKNISKKTIHNLNPPKIKIFINKSWKHNIFNYF